MKPSEVFVRATDSNKTIESAVALMMGMYPDCDYSLGTNQT